MVTFVVRTEVVFEGSEMEESFEEMDGKQHEVVKNIRNTSRVFHQLFLLLTFVLGSQLLSFV